MALDTRRPVIEDLLSLPFPQETTRTEDHCSGPGYHVRVLQASQDFWEAPSEETIQAAEEEIDLALRELVSALTARWGNPQTIDLDPYLWSETPATEPMNPLCQLSTQMLLWRPPELDRWVALTVGQADREFPIQLLVTVADTPLP